MKPKLEEIREKYKNVLLVKSSYNGTIDEIYLDTLYKDYKGDFICSTKKQRIFLWTNDRGYAEIISYKEEIKDSIVESVVNQFKERSEVGIKKYNTTLDRIDLSTLDWINHAQQEAMDFVLYLEKLKKEYENNGNA